MRNGPARAPTPSKPAPTVSAMPRPSQVYRWRRAARSFGNTGASSRCWAGASTVTEIAADEGFYDYRAKYTDGFARHLVPAPIDPSLFEQVTAWSEEAHRLLGCRGVSRCDFRYDPAQGERGLHLLEINTQPGMTPLSLVPEQAKHRGIEFKDLVVKLVEDAACDL